MDASRVIVIGRKTYPAGRELREQVATPIAVTNGTARQ